MREGSGGWRRALGGFGECPRNLRSASVAFLFLLGACQASTTRPSFVPQPEAAHAEVQLPIDTATVRLAAAFRADSFPVSKIRPRDGFLETPWFDSATLRATGKRPVGEGVVKVRGWVGPAKPSFSAYEIEAVYVPLVDPSRPPRELEVALPSEHPVSKRIAAIMKKLVAQYGVPDAPPPAPAARAAVPLPALRPVPPPADTTARAAKRDTTGHR